MNVQIWNKLCNSIICILSVTTNIWKTRWNSNSCVLKQEKKSVSEASSQQQCSTSQQLYLCHHPTSPAETVVPVQPQLPSPTSPAVQWNSCAGTAVQLPSPASTGSRGQQWSVVLCTTQPPATNHRKLRAHNTLEYFDVNCIITILYIFSSHHTIYICTSILCKHYSVLSLHFMLNSFIVV